MKVLFIGGTGNISLDCTHEALRHGIEVFHLNRGTHPEMTPEGVQTLQGDIRNEKETAKLLSGMSFDVVVNWVAFDVNHIESDIRLFAGRTRQYVFISSASAYKKPVTDRLITEGTVLHNPFWEYSRKKIACEERLIREFRENAFPVTIVRPSHTYSTGWLPTSFGSRDFTVAWRMLQGKPIIVHGDGESLWTLTHTEDFAVGFVGLLGNPDAVGEVFQITSDEALSWNRIHRIIATALGARPTVVHIPSSFIGSLYPSRGAELLGDKAYTVVFDNSKIKRWVPRFKAAIPFHEGMRRSVAWFHAHPELMRPEGPINDEIEKILAAWGARSS